MTQVCVLERVVRSRRGPIISALMQQSEINKYRALGLSTFPYPQQSLGWFTKSNWLSVPAPAYIIQYSKIKIMKRGLSFLMHQGVVLAGASHAQVPSQPGFKVASEMKRLRHKIQPVPHTLCETQCLSLSKLLSSDITLISTIYNVNKHNILLLLYKLYEHCSCCHIHYCTVPVMHLVVKMPQILITWTSL